MVAQRAARHRASSAKVRHSTVALADVALKSQAMSPSVDALAPVHAAPTPMQSRLGWHFSFFVQR